MRLIYVCVCVCVCVRMCASACGGGCSCTGACVCLSACSLTNPACNTLPYCHLRPFWLHHSFRHYLTNGTIFGGKKVTEYKMCVLIFSTTVIWNISHSKKNSARYRQKCENYFMWSIRYSFRILIKLEISRQVFEKKAQVPSSIIIRPVGAELFHAGRRTDGRTWRS
jgi:hypothetical protein